MNTAKRFSRLRDKRQDSKKNASTESVAVTKSPQINLESPICLESATDFGVSGHSTPLRTKDNEPDVEDSPELDYRCSPIPCTQDTNEIAWDWQCGNTRTRNKESSRKNNLLETPKRTKALRKKRNTNSPLFQQTKWKQIKRDNVEDNIKELAVELKALGEKVINMKQKGGIQQTNGDDRKNLECETQLIIELDSQKDEAVPKVTLNNNKFDIESSTMKNVNEKNASYEDFFDDSIDDFMVKCSQEVEEKFHLNATKKDSASDLSLFNDHNSHKVRSNNTTDSSENSSCTKNSLTVNVNKCLKTYSKNSTKANTISTTHTTNLRNKLLQKPESNNHSTIVYKTDCNSRKSLEEKTCEMFEIPDDSFDDCLASCIDEEKLSSASSEIDIFSNMKQMNLPSSSNKSTTINNNTKIPSLLSNREVSSHETSSSTIKNKVGTAQNDITGSSSSNTVTESRKFFKTKSLSEQSFTNIGKAMPAARKLFSSWQGRPNVSIVDSSISSSSCTVVEGQKDEGNKVQLINGVQTEPTFNRSIGKEGSSRFVKYKSTSNLCNINESTKNVHPVRCTPEEIERKRLEAKTRLQAKRKLAQSMRTINSQLKMSTKNSVNR